MLTCQSCPVAYHPTCMGYDSSFPRRKWRCYHCKIVKYGIKCNLTKIAPNESQWCKVFLTTIKPHWKETAMHLMNVLKEYPASRALWYTKKDSKQKSLINMTKILRKIKHDVELLKIGAPATSEETTEKYEN